MIYQNTFPNNPHESPQAEFYIGKIGDRLQDVAASFNQSVGESNWRFCWRANSEVVSFLGMCSLYEASYGQYFDEHPDDITKVSKYHDVYDDSPSNTAAGTNLESVLRDTSIHLQDVIVRRLLKSRGVGFTESSSDLLQIRSTSRSDLGKRLSPLFVPFIEPEIICEDNPLINLTGKMQPGSVEHFYHANRRLAISGLASSEVFCQAFQAQFGEAIQLQPVPVTVRK